MDKKKQFPIKGRIIQVDGKTALELNRAKSREELEKDVRSGDPGAISERLRRSGL